MSPECQTAFEKLKEGMINDPTLKCPDVDKNILYILMLVIHALVLCYYNVVVNNSVKDLFLSHKLSPRRINMIGRYEIEAKALTINRVKNKFILLKEEEIKKCTNPLLNFCQLMSPAYSIHQNKLCVSLIRQNQKANL